MKRNYPHDADFEYTDKEDISKEYDDLATCYLMAYESYMNFILEPELELKHMPPGMGFNKEHPSNIKPAIYLFRHYVELKLKSFIKRIEKKLGEENSVCRTHIISTIYCNLLIPKWKEAKKSGCLDRDIAELFGAGEYDELIFIIKIFDWIDKNGDRYRYPENRDGDTFFCEDDGEYKAHQELFKCLCSIPKLKGFTDKVYKYLADIDGYLDFIDESDQETLMELKDCSDESSQESFE